MMNPVQEFLEDVERQLNRAGCLFLMEDSPTVDMGDGLPCAGFWLEDQRVLKVAEGVSRIQFIETLAHEFSHFRQWLEQRPAYSAPSAPSPSGPSYEEVFWDSLKNAKAYPKKLLLKASALMREMELDCERVALRVFREYHLPVDIESYCQKASSYIHFYNVAGETGQWYNPHAKPYDCPELIQRMPKDLSGDYSKTPPAITKYIRDHCLSPPRG